MRLMTGAWVAQAIASVTRLNVPDLLQQHGAQSARELCARHGVDAKPEFLERALRACASVGVFSEDAQGRFGPTALSEALTLDSPGSAKRFAELIGGRWWQSWGALGEALRTGQAQADEPQSGWASDDPAQIEVFGEAMKSRLAGVRGLLERCDLSGSRRLVDVGGGFGHMASFLLARHPGLRATVLDLPAVIAVAERRAASEAGDVRARLEFAGGDMFADVPQGDAYLLSGILHDWDDGRCLRVLRNCRTRIARGGRIFAIDSVLPPLGDTSATSAKLLDLLMMVSLPGKERTEAEWRALYDGAGLEIVSITTLDPQSRSSLVEGTPL
jgi:hypothetical protein